MGPALVNNRNPKFQARASLKRCGNGYCPGTKMSEKRRCFRSKNSMLNSSIGLQHKNSNVIELSSSAEDEDQNTLLKHSGEKNDSHSLKDDIDLGYKIFLEHLREDGKSYVLEMVNALDGKPVCVRYEGEDVSSDEVESHDRSNSEGISSKGRSACPGKKNQKSHKSGLSSQGKNKSSGDKSGQIIVRSSPVDHNHKPESLVDESYQIFLNHVRVHGDSLFLELENGVVVKYEEENEVCSGPEGSATKTPLCCSEQESGSHTTSQQPSDSSAYEDDGSSSKNCTPFQFERELMACLDMPFDKKEHDELLHQAKTRKTLERQRILRSRSVSYATKRRSLSYLDYFPDLAKQIKDADPNRTLFLLRGFFFWLKNLSHEGSYKPWVLPQSHEIVPLSSHDYEMTPLIQIARPGGVKEETDIELLEILS